jgi:translation initiation factor IF-3
MKKEERTRINEGIRATEVRVVGPDGNLGVLPIRVALEKAQAYGMDLIEISPNAIPPVCKIMDYGKFNYEQKRHLREKRAKERTATVEIKSIQIKVGTGEGDILTKIKKIEEWLTEGQRIKVELYLQGRSKYVEKSFLHDRIRKFLAYITTPYNIVDGFKEAPKGISLIIERNKKIASEKPLSEKNDSPADTDSIA